MGDEFYSLEFCIWEGWRTLIGENFRSMQECMDQLANEENQ